MKSTFFVKLSIYGLIFLLTSSCDSKKTDSTQSDTIDTPNQTFQQASKFTNDSSGSLFETVKKLNLEDIRNRFDGTQIRIWLGYALSDSGKVIILNKINKIWTGSILYFKYHDHYNDSIGFTIDSISKKIVVNDPLSGWSSFITQFESLGIYQLKDCDHIAGYAICNDGDGLTFEIAKQNHYQRFDYPCYDLYEKTIDEVIGIKKMLTLIESQFGFRLFPRPRY